LNQQSAKQRTAIVGIGNLLRSDDAAGILVARGLMNSQSLLDSNIVLVIDAGQAPENRTADLRRFAPKVILLIDAAEIGEMPGTIHWIEVDELEGMSASTHTLPLSIAQYLTLELNCKIALLGIQPKSNDIRETISPEVSEAVHALTEDLIRIFTGKY